MNLDARYKEFLSILPVVMKEIGFELSNDLQKSIKKQFRKDDSKVFNRSDVLRKKSGGLLASFSDKDPDSLTKIDFSGGKLNFNFGSKKVYAEIQEKGGFIKGSNKMEGFFWAKYYETKKEDYRIIALSVKKKGGVNIKGRNYFSNGVKEFEANVFPKFISRAAKNLLKAWESTN